MKNRQAITNPIQVQILNFAYLVSNADVVPVSAWKDRHGEGPRKLFSIDGIRASKKRTHDAPARGADLKRVNIPESPIDYVRPQQCSEALGQPRTCERVVTQFHLQHDDHATWLVWYLLAARFKKTSAAEPQETAAVSA